MTLNAGLYVVATPIGNLGDMTLRAIETLKGVDLIACEDTRVTAKLLSRFGIAAKTTSYNDHNAEAKRPHLLAQMEAGRAVALVSDAGTPLISDPGYKLVREARERGLAVIPIPGASSVMAALMAAGLPTDKFFFAGFLPPKDAARDKAITALAAIPATLVFFESAGRLAPALAALAKTLGAREAAVARELTKLHEEVAHGNLVELASRYAKEGAPKGEIVILVAPPGEKAWPQAEIDAALAAALHSGASVRDAARTVAERTGLSRQALYARALEIKG